MFDINIFNPITHPAAGWLVGAILVYWWLRFIVLRMDHEITRRGVMTIILISITSPIGLVLCAILTIGEFRKLFPSIRVRVLRKDYWDDVIITDRKERGKHV